MSLSSSACGSRSHGPRLAATGAAIVAGAVLISAGAAGAHTSFDRSSVPASSEEVLQVRVPVEDFNDPTTFNNGVRVRLPVGFDARSCETPLGWTCTVEARADSGENVVWMRTNGTGPLDLLDFTVFTIDEVGSYRVPVDQSKSNGELVAWENGADEEHPAPVLEVTAGGSEATESGPGEHDGSDDGPPRPEDDTEARVQPSADTPSVDQRSAAATTSDTAAGPDDEPDAATGSGASTTATPGQDDDESTRTGLVMPGGRSPELAAGASSAQPASSTRPGLTAGIVGAALVSMAAAAVLIARRRATGREAGRTG